MSDSQKRFFDELLAHYPRLAEYWDREDRSFLDEKATATMGVLSCGERVVLKALAAIWMGSAEAPFKLDFSGVGALSPNFRKPLVDWLLNPFWP